MCTKQVSGADTEHLQHTKMVLMDISSSNQWIQSLIFSMECYTRALKRNLINICYFQDTFKCVCNGLFTMRIVHIRDTHIFDSQTTFSELNSKFTVIPCYKFAEKWKKLTIQLFQT